MGKSTKSSAVLPAALKRAKRFTLVWCVFFVVVILMAAVEGIVLWLGGFRYDAPTALKQACIGDFSIDTNGDWAAARVSFKRHSTSEGSWDDVVLIDLRRLDARRLDLRDLQPRCVALSPTADTLAIACADGAIYVWSPMPGRLQENSAAKDSLRLFGRSVERDFAQLVFSPDGRRLAATGNSYTCLWQWPEGALLHQQRHGNGYSRALCFSADSQSFVSPGEAGQVVLRDANTGQSISSASVEGECAMHATLSQDAQLLALFHLDPPNVISVHSLETEKELWNGVSSAPAVALSPDGRLLAACSGRGPYRIRIYDAKSGERLGEMTGHEHQVVGLKFSSSSLLYSWDAEGLVRTWDVTRQRKQWSFSIIEWASGE